MPAGLTSFVRGISAAFRAKMICSTGECERVDAGEDHGKGIVCDERVAPFTWTHDDGCFA